MNGARRLHDAGQSFWLDNITCALVTSGSLARYIEACSISGLTSNPTIFNHAIKRRPASKARNTLLGACAPRLAARRRPLPPVHEVTNRVDGWVSMEVSPTLAYDTESNLAAAKALHGRAGARAGSEIVILIRPERWCSRNLGQSG
jgi:transaldolase